MFKNLGNPENPITPIKEIKEFVFSKLGFYTERMQKSLNSATQKYLGDCEEPKTVYKIYNLMTKVIATPIANIFVGEVSIEILF
jgi:hypothetical protein